MEDLRRIPGGRPREPGRRERQDPASDFDLRAGTGDRDDDSTDRASAAGHRLPGRVHEGLEVGVTLVDQVPRLAEAVTPGEPPEPPPERLVGPPLDLRIQSRLHPQAPPVE